jgi:hypothetical protein
MTLLKPDLGKIVYLALGIAVAKMVLPKIGG